MLQTYRQMKIIKRYLKDVFPGVDQELDIWKTRAGKAPDEVLKSQALLSIRWKRFHCQGGGVYALYPGAKQETIIKFIVALQTISDYLDNLCDRAGYQEEKGFRQLHLAMTEALSPEGPISDYYAFYPQQNDGRYLASLVEECQSCLRTLPSYHLVQSEMVQLASLYSDLQSLKHIEISLREEKMLKWIDPYLKTYHDISPWEFAAATGSTLGIFMFAAVAFDPQLTPEEVMKIRKAYFPYLCGLHILLDYFIDQLEDQNEGDLNFVFYYKHKAEMQERLSYFLQKALEQVSLLKNPEFHITVIEGLLAMYLSDPKASHTSIADVSNHLIKVAGKRTSFLHLVCKQLRRKGTL